MLAKIWQILGKIAGKEHVIFHTLQKRKYVVHTKDLNTQHSKIVIGKLVYVEVSLITLNSLIITVNVNRTANEVMKMKQYG